MAALKWAAYQRKNISSVAKMAKAAISNGSSAWRKYLNNERRKWRKSAG
jgi:hypothetical protein